jgi:hypothetical protein
MERELEELEAEWAYREAPRQHDKSLPANPAVTPQLDMHPEANTMLPHQPAAATGAVPRQQGSRQMSRPKLMRTLGMGPRTPNLNLKSQGPPVGAQERI